MSLKDYCSHQLPFPMSVDWVDDPDLGVDALIWMGVPGYYGTQVLSTF